MEENYGISVIFKRGAPLILKVLWLIVLCVSICVLAIYLKECYIKLKITPEILINEKYIDSNDIPFPAVTICSPMVAKIEFLNVSNVFEGLKENNIMEPEDHKMMTATSFFCDQHLKVTKLQENTPIVDVAGLLDNIQPNTEDSFEKCKFGLEKGCANATSRLLTHLGYCFTLNMLDFKYIFNEKVKNLVTHKSDSRTESNNQLWSIENGYPNKDASYPLRASRSNRFYATMRVNDNELPNICADRLDTYQAIIHPPNEYPTVFHPFFSFELRKYKFLSINAELRKQDYTLKKLSFEHRRCYFDGERTLNLFKIYTKNNCEYECLVNFTYSSCGCVGVAMPRTENVKVCGLESIKCYKDNLFKWPDKYYESEFNRKHFLQFPCNCMPSCTQITYKVNREFTFEKSQKSDDITNSKIDILFDDSQIIETTNYITYKVQNFISDIGGLAGLFLGFSLLSLFEMILRIFAFFKNRARKFRVAHKN